MKNIKLCTITIATSVALSVATMENNQLHFLFHTRALTYSLASTISWHNRRNKESNPQDFLSVSYQKIYITSKNKNKTFYSILFISLLQAHTFTSRVCYFQFLFTAIFSSLILLQHYCKWMMDDELWFSYGFWIPIRFAPSNRECIM